MLKLFSAFGELTLQGADAVNNGLAGATKAAENFSGKMASAGKTMSGVGDTMSKAVTGPIVGVGAALGGLAFRAIATGDDLAKFGRAVNLGVESLQEYEFALGRIAGVSQQETRRALRELTQTIADGTAGDDKAVASLQALGFSLDDIKNGAVSTEAAMDAVLDSIRNAGSAAEAQALAMEMFGNRVGTQLANNIREGAESVDEARKVFREQIGGLTQEQAEMAEKAADAWDVFKRSLSQTALLIGAEALPMLIELIEIGNQSLIPMLAKGAAGLAGMIKAFTEMDPWLRNSILAFVGLLAAVGPVLSIVGRLLVLFSGFTKTIAFVASAAAALKVALVPIGVALATLSAPVLAIIAALALLGTALFLNRDRVAGWLDSIKGFLQQSFVDFLKWKDNVVKLALELGREVGRAIADMGRRVLASVNDMVRGALSSMRNLYRRAVGNSIIPDLAADVTQAVKGMADASISQTERMSKGMLDSMMSAAPRDFASGMADQGVPAGGRGNIINLQHAVFNTEAGTDRALSLTGHDITGAF